MRKYILIASGALMMSSCNNSELETSNRTKDSLLSVLSEKNAYLVQRDSSINNFIAYFNDVERNLDSIAVKQHVILLNSDKVELKHNQKERINTAIKGINDLMDRNRKIIADLKKRLKTAGNKNVEMERTIVMMTDQLAQKDIELSYLNEKLNLLNLQVAQLQTSVETLTMENEAKSQMITEGETSMHTAYYVVGKSKDLEEAKIIDKEGGLLGMGKTAKLSSNVDKDKFTRIDYTRSNVIPINGEKVKIVTTHPSDSYILEKDDKDDEKVKNLVITNSEKFWAASKYLVVSN